MNAPNIIAELLRRGVMPNEDDASSLRELGAFAAHLLSRYTESERRDIGGGSDRLVQALATSRGGVGHSGRWLDGIGFGALVDDEYWQSLGTAALPAAGYGDIESQLETLTLMEEEGAIAAADVVENTDGVRGRRAGLFGRRRPAPAAPKARETQAKSVVAPSAVAPKTSGRSRAWSLGPESNVASETLRLLTEGGLPVVDQVIRAERAKDASLARMPNASIASSSNLDNFEPWRRQRSVSLDGVTVDSRLPALAASLFEAGASRFEPTRMGLESPAVRGAALGRQPPGYAFFDASENTFLTLEAAQESSRGVTSASHDDVTSAGAVRSANVRRETRATATTSRRGINLPIRLADVVRSSDRSLSVPPNELARLVLASNASNVARRTGDASFAGDRRLVSPQPASGLAGGTSSSGQQGLDDMPAVGGAAVVGGGPYRTDGSTAARDSRFSTMLGGVEPTGLAAGLSQGNLSYKQRAPNNKFNPPGAFFATGIAYRADGAAISRESRSSAGGSRRLMAALRFGANAQGPVVSQRGASAVDAGVVGGIGSMQDGVEGVISSPGQRNGGVAPFGSGADGTSSAGEQRAVARMGATGRYDLDFGFQPEWKGVSTSVRWFDGSGLETPMPLGATFTAPEAFTIHHALGAGIARDISAVERFVPTVGQIAAGANGAASRRDWVDSAVDGAVWLTLEQVGQATAIGESDRRLGLSVVPERGNSVQVPARTAVRGLLAASGQSTPRISSDFGRGDRAASATGADVGLGGLEKPAATQRPSNAGVTALLRAGRLAVGASVKPLDAASVGDLGVGPGRSQGPLGPVRFGGQGDRLPPTSLALGLANVPGTSNVQSHERAIAQGAERTLVDSRSRSVDGWSTNVASDLSAAVGRSVWAPDSATAGRVGAGVGDIGLDSALGGLFTGVTSVNESARFNAALTQVAKARQSMLRPVPTAREALDVLMLNSGVGALASPGLLNGDGPTAQTSGSVGLRAQDGSVGAARPAVMPHHQSLDVFGTLARRIGGVSGPEPLPVLSRLLEARSSRFQSVAGGGGTGIDAFLDNVRASVGERAPAVREMLMKQGWSAAELDLLVQDGGVDSFALAGVDAGMTRSAGVRGASTVRREPVRQEASSVADYSTTVARPTSSAATTDRFARNLARTLTGSLAVGGSPASDAGGVSVANAVARQQASAYLGALAGRGPDPYFGSAAPAAGLANRLGEGIGARRLAHEVTELATAARGDVLRTNSPLSFDARRQIAANLKASETLVARRQASGRQSDAMTFNPVERVQAALAERETSGSMSLAEIESTLDSAGVDGVGRRRIFDALVGASGSIDVGARFEPATLKGLVARELARGASAMRPGDTRILAERGVITSALAERLELGEFLTIGEIESGLAKSGLESEARGRLMASLRSMDIDARGIPAATVVGAVEKIAGFQAPVSARVEVSASLAAGTRLRPGASVLEAFGDRPSISIVDTAERAAAFSGEGGLRALAERGVVPMALADRAMLGDFVSVAEVEAAMNDRGASPEVRRSVLEAFKAEKNRTEGAKRPAIQTEPAGRLARAISDIVVSASGIAQGASKTITAGADAISTRGVDASRLGYSAMDAAAGWRLLSERGVNPMQLGDVDMSFVASETERTPNESVVASGLGGRLAGAMALSAAGPAGATRLAGAAARAGTGKAPRTGVAEGPVVGPALDPAARTVRPAVVAPRGYAKGWRASAASVREERARDLPIGLNSVLSPEVMMSGLRSLEVSKAIREMSIRGVDLFENLGVLTTLADSGIDLAAARTSTSASVRAVGGAIQAGAEREALIARMVARAERAGGSAAGSALSEILLKGADPVEAVGRARLSRRERAGLLSSILRGSERAETASIFEGAGAADFAFEWLSRVDGSKSGIDVGMGQAREATAKTFGARRDSRVAMASPMGDANLVASAAPRAAAMAGSQVAPHARGVASAMAGKASSADAIRRTDWRLVDTGAKGGTSHADLGKLASALVSNRGGGPSAVPMALVAPAAKTVAQTALRSERGDQATSTAPAPDPAATQGPAGAGEFSLSEEALELLAVEMAGLVAEIFESEKERTGQSW